MAIDLTEDTDYTIDPLTGRLLLTVRPMAPPLGAPTASDMLTGRTGGGQSPVGVDLTGGGDPTKQILQDSVPDNDASREKLMEGIVQAIGESEQQSSVRSPLRDLLTSESATGFGDVGTTPTPQVDLTQAEAPTPVAAQAPPAQTYATAPPDLTQAFVSHNEVAPTTDLPPPSPDLTQEAAPKRSSIMDFIASIPRGIMSGLADNASALGTAATLEMGQQPDVEGIPSADAVTRLLEQNVTGALPQPQGLAGQLGRAFGEGVGSPSSYVAPMGPAANAVISGGIGSTIEAIKQLISPASAATAKPAAVPPNTFFPADPNLPQPQQPVDPNTFKGPVYPAPGSAIIYSPEEAGKLADAQAHPPTSAAKAWLGLALGTVVAMVAPRMLRSIMSGKVPPLRTVENAVPGTLAVSQNRHLARVVDNPDAALVSVARLAGVDPVVIDQLEKAFPQLNRMGAVSLVDSAIKYGHAETPVGVFRSAVALEDLAKRETAIIREYMQAKHIAEEINLLYASARGVNATGPIKYRGMTYDDVLRFMTLVERKHPEAKQFAKDYENILKNVYKYEFNGQYGTMSKAEYATNNQTRISRTNFERGLIDDPKVSLGSPTNNLATYMHNAMRARMENEIRGMYIDAYRKANLNFAPLASADWRFFNRGNRAATDNTITVYRRGKPFKYTVDPFVADNLRTDPYHLSGGGAAMVLNTTKRWLEETTTRRLNPAFAPVDAWRNLWIAQLTTPVGRKRPTLLRSIAAIPRQLGPQIGGAIAKSIVRPNRSGLGPQAVQRMAQSVADTLPPQLVPQVIQSGINSIARGSGGWVNRVLGPQETRILSQKLLNMVNNSVYMQLERAGTTKGSVFVQNEKALAKLQQASNNETSQILHTMLKGWESWLGSVHNAPNFAYGARNLGRAPKGQVAAEARNLVADPRIKSGYYVRGSSGNYRPVRMEGTDKGLGVVTHTAARVWAGTHHFLGEVAPWHNMAIQGPKRIAAAYAANPVGFTMRMWGLVGAPAVANYAWNVALGKDPNGVSYSDYNMNGRSTWAQQMVMYWGLPGRPVADGVNFIHVHEFAPFWRATQVAMDHTLGNNMMSLKDDFMRASWGLLTSAIEPPMPPIVNALTSFAGISSFGIYTGDVTPRGRSSPYDPTQTVPQGLEMASRALFGASADYVLTAYKAGARTPAEEGFAQAVVNGLKGTLKRIIQKTPLGPELTGTDKPPQTGRSELVDAMFAKQRVLDDLNKFYNQYGLDGKFKMSTKPASKSGGEYADQRAGPPLAGSAYGEDYPPPNNELYYKYMPFVRDQSKRDAFEKGGVGFRSLWRKYADASKMLRTMYNINEGSHVTWQNKIGERPDVIGDLEKHGVNPDNPKDVRNYLESRRQETAKQILLETRAMEARISKMVGRPITLEDLHPYKDKRIINPDADPEFPESLKEAVNGLEAQSGQDRFGD